MFNANVCDIINTSDAGSTGEEQRPAGSLSNEASQARPVHAGRVLMQGRD